MKKSKIIGIALSALVLGSCASSSDVVDGGLFQKRKYNKGWNINKKSKIEIDNGKANDIEIAEATLVEDVDTDFSNDKTVSNLHNSNSLETSTYTEDKEPSHKLTATPKQETSTFEAPSEVLESEKTLSSVSSNSVSKSNVLKRRVSELVKRNFSLNFSDNTSDTSGDSEILLIILAILIPPLAVGLFEGITTRFWIDLLLTFLFYLPGMIYALLIVLGVI